MKNVFAFARALLTMLALVSLTILLGGLALVVGIFHPLRRLMNFCSWAWSGIILFIAGARVTIKGWDNVRESRPAFFIGNHQSDLDIPIILQAMGGDVRFMAKDSLFRIPLFGWVIRRYGFVPIDRRDVRKTLRTLTKMLADMQRNPISMTAFPEGTRSRDGRLLPFRRGTMKIVQQAGLPVIPFAIDGSNRVHCPGRLLRVYAGPVTLTFADPIPADQVVSMDQDDLQQVVISAVAIALGQPVPSRENLGTQGEPLILSAARSP